MSTPGREFSWDHASRGVISPGMPRRGVPLDRSWRRRRVDRARLRREGGRDSPLPDDCDINKPGFPVRQRLTPAAERARRSSPSPAPRLRGTRLPNGREAPRHIGPESPPTGFPPGRPGDEARGPGRHEGKSKRWASEDLPRPAVPRGKHARPQGSLRGQHPPTRRAGGGTIPGLEEPRKCPREDLNLHPVTWTRT